MILVDTDIMVGIMRRHPPSVAWLDSLGTDVVGIPGLVAMELLQGCQSREEQQQLEGFLRRYRRYWPSQPDCARAFDDFAAYHLSHGLGILDALIAETALGLGVQLASSNTKHYGVLATLEIVQPYLRE